MKSIFSIVGVGKNVEIANLARLRNLRDSERAYASQYVMSRIVLQHPLLEGANILKTHLFNLDRVSLVISPESSNWRLLPKNYREMDGVIKIAGTRVQGFLVKLDMVVIASGDVLPIVAILKDKNIPDGETLKLQVHLKQNKNVQYLSKFAIFILGEGIR